MLEKASTIINALTLIRPTSQWVLRNDPCDYDSLEWLDSEQIKPTEEELLTAINIVLINLANTEYQRLRAPKYPTIGDQLDALFHAGVFPSDMAAQIQAVKDQYPKP